MVFYSISVSLVRHNVGATANDPINQQSVGTVTMVLDLLEFFLSQCLLCCTPRGNKTDIIENRSLLYAIIWLKEFNVKDAFFCKQWGQVHIQIVIS